MGIKKIEDATFRPFRQMALQGQFLDGTIACKQAADSLWRGRAALLGHCLKAMGGFAERLRYCVEFLAAFGAFGNHMTQKVVLKEVGRGLQKTTEQP